jgi:raffinose/stachyose/melibiose transport system substrate-binding protein
MRKSMVLASVAAAGVLMTACSPGGDSTATSTDDAGGDKSTSETVSIWYLADAVGVEEAIERFSAENPDVEVDAQPYANDQYKTKLKVALGTPNGPDVFHTWGGGEFKTYVDAGQVADLGELGATTDGISEAALKTGEFDGKQYAVPVTVEASMVWYRTDVFDELSLTPPKTWPEFLDVISKTKEAGLVPIAMANKPRWPGTHWWSELVAQSCGPDFVQSVTDGAATFDDPCVVKAHGHIQELVDAGAFNEGFNGLDYDPGESRQLFWSGKAAMNHMGNWTVGSAREEAPEVLEKMAMFTLPAVPDAKVSNAAMTGGTNLFAISEATENKEAAVALLTELTGQEHAEVLAAGGRIPVRDGVEVDDPLLQQVADAMSEAPSLTPWPDQFLAPEVAEVLLAQTQALFGKETTPEQAAQALSAAQAKVA